MSTEIEALSSKLEELKKQRSKVRLLESLGIHPTVHHLQVDCSYSEQDDPANEYYVCEKATLSIAYEEEGKTQRCRVEFVSTSPDENGNRYQYTTSLGIEGTKEGPIFKELFEMLKEDPHEWKAFIKNLAA